MVISSLLFAYALSNKTFAHTEAGGIVIAKYQMTTLDVSIEQCKQALGNELLAKHGSNSRQRTKAICSAPTGFNAPMVTSDSLVYAGRLVGQTAYFEAHKQNNVVHWECHVYPKIFATFRSV